MLGQPSHSSAGSAASWPSDPKRLMHSVGRYLQSPPLLQSLYRYFGPNLAPDNVLKIDPLLSVPSKSHTTDILIFWEARRLHFGLLALCSLLKQGERTDVLRTDALCNSQRLSANRVNSPSQGTPIGPPNLCP